MYFLYCFEYLMTNEMTIDVIVDVKVNVCTILPAVVRGRFCTTRRYDWKYGYTER